MFHAVVRRQCGAHPAEGKIHAGSLWATSTRYFNLSLLGVPVHGPVAVEPIANCQFHRLSPLFCTALRRLISRAVQPASHA